MQLQGIFEAITVKVHTLVVQELHSSYSMGIQ